MSSGTSPRDVPNPDGPQRNPRPARRPPAPNYLARRGVVAGGVVAVLIAAAVIVGQLLGSGEPTSQLEPVDADWNRIVLLDDATGQVTVVGPSGESLLQVDSGTTSPSASKVIDTTMLVATPEKISLVDLAVTADDEAVRTDDFGADEVVKPTGTALTMIAIRSAQDRALLVHGPSGEYIDTESGATVAGARYEFAESRSSPSGRDVLVTDSGNFQSVLFSFDEPNPSFFPGLALAIGEDVAVTAQNVGNDATVSVFDHAGEPLATGRTPAVRGAMVAGDRVVLVTAEGSVVQMDIDTGDTGDATELDIGMVEAGYVTTSGNRLVVGGTTGVAVIDENAEVVGVYADSRLLDDDAAPSGSRCIALIPLAEQTSPGVTIADLGDGETQVVGPAQSPRYSDASGCIIAATTPAGYDLLGTSDTEAPEADRGDELVALAPDGSVVVVERAGRLLLLGGFPGQATPESPIDLGAGGNTVLFAEL